MIKAIIRWFSILFFAATAAMLWMSLDYIEEVNARREAEVSDMTKDRDKWKKRALDMSDITVTVTGYTSSPDETDSDPHIGAFMLTVDNDTIAPSRDLLSRFPPGCEVWVEGLGRRIVKDIPAKDKVMLVDAWCATKEEARKHVGNKKRRIVRMWKKGEVEV